MVDFLDIHLSTDIVTGDLRIDFDPPEGHHIPVDIDEWPQVRRTLRQRVREEELNATDAWVPYLDSERTGERLDVRVGFAVVLSDGQISQINVTKTEPEAVDW